MIVTQILSRYYLPLPLLLFLFFYYYCRMQYSLKCFIKFSDVLTLLGSPACNQFRLEGWWIWWSA